MPSQPVWLYRGDFNSADNNINNRLFLAPHFFYLKNLFKKKVIGGKVFNSANNNVNNRLFMSPYLIRAWGAYKGLPNSTGEAASHTVASLSAV